MKTAPGPRGSLLLGSYRDYRRDPLGFFLRTAQEYGGLVRYRFAHKPAFLVSEPALIRRVLQENAKNYAKGISYESLRLLLGQGLLVSEGELWKKQRRLAQPAFHRDRLELKSELIAACAREMIARWTGRIDLVSEFMRFAFDVVGRALMGADIEGEMREVEAVLADAVDFIVRHMESPVKFVLPKRRFRECAARLRAVVDRVVARHREPGTLLAALLEAGMDGAQLRDEVLTFLLAGHETTGDALCWTWWLLSKNPDVDPRHPHVVDEAMRLYPPAWSFTRTALARDELGGYAIPKGAIVVLSPWVNHRLPRFWDDPEAFRPGRFEGADFDTYVYFPFGGGPHSCIGKHLSLIELRIAMREILAAGELRIEPGQDVRPVPSISLKPSGPIWARLAR